MKHLLPAVVEGSNICEHLDTGVILIWLSNLKFLHPNKRVRYPIGFKANAHQLATKLVTQQVGLLPESTTTFWWNRGMYDNKYTQLSRWERKKILMPFTQLTGWKSSWWQRVFFFFVLGILAESTDGTTISSYLAVRGTWRENASAFHHMIP